MILSVIHPGAFPNTGWLGIVHRLRFHSVERSPDTWGDVALINWQTDRSSFAIAFNHC